MDCFLDGLPVDVDALEEGRAADEALDVEMREALVVPVPR